MKTEILGVPVSNIKVVPENIMVECAAEYNDDASTFRKAGLTPIYLCTESFKDLFVTSKEHMRKEFN
jgi:hypothetical protein